MNVETNLVLKSTSKDLDNGTGHSDHTSNFSINI